jgi:hypothetical protein
MPAAGPSIDGPRVLVSLEQTGHNELPRTRACTHVIRVRELLVLGRCTGLHLVTAALTASFPQALRLFGNFLVVIPTSCGLTLVRVTHCPSIGTSIRMIKLFGDRVAPT